MTPTMGGRRDALLPRSTFRLSTRHAILAATHLACDANGTERPVTIRDAVSSCACAFAFVPERCSTLFYSRVFFRLFKCRVLARDKAKFTRVQAGCETAVAKERASQTRPGYGARAIRPCVVVVAEREVSSSPASRSNRYFVMISVLVRCCPVTDLARSNHHCCETTLRERCFVGIPQTQSCSIRSRVVVKHI